MDEVASWVCSRLNRWMFRLMLRLDLRLCVRDSRIQVLLTYGDVDIRLLEELARDIVLVPVLFRRLLRGRLESKSSREVDHPREMWRKMGREMERDLGRSREIGQGRGHKRDQGRDQETGREAGVETDITADIGIDQPPSLKTKRKAKDGENVEENVVVVAKKKIPTKNATAT